MLHVEAQFSSLDFFDDIPGSIAARYVPCTGRLMRHLEAEWMRHLRAQAAKPGADEHPAVIE
jgi:hypothetical protein